MSVDLRMHLVNMLTIITRECREGSLHIEGGSPDGRMIRLAQRAAIETRPASMNENQEIAEDKKIGE